MYAIKTDNDKFLVCIFNEEWCDWDVVELDDDLTIETFNDISFNTLKSAEELVNAINSKKYIFEDDRVDTYTEKWKIDRIVKLNYSFTCHVEEL